MPVRTIRVRRLAVSATAAVLAALLLTGCKDGMGVRDEGPSGTTPTQSSR
ncbi:hypothetical protein [Streptomyces sp. NPDC002276]